MTGFDIGSRHVGDGAPCLIVGEVAQGHHGSYDLAHAFIDAIADAGADAVKFQARIAEAESWPEEPWRVKPRWGTETRYEYWKRMEFTPQQWSELARHADERGLIFLASPFSLEAVAMLDALVPAWKVASGEVANVNLLEKLAGTCKPVILSAGMASDVELARAVIVLTTASWPFRNCGRPHPALLYCTSLYPTPPEMAGLDRVSGSTWRGPVGLSDHSGTTHAGLAAVALGCDILEVHVKLSDYDPGPDASSSITVPQLKQLVEGVRFVEAAKKPVDKDAMAKELAPMRALFMDRNKRKAEATQ